MPTLILAAMTFAVDDRRVSFLGEFGGSPI